MIEAFLVRIRVPTKDGKGRTATGYAVAPDRILTASHMLHEADIDGDQPLRVFWYGSDEDSEGTPCRGIAWDGHPEFDAAVLDVPFPEELRPWVLLAEDKPISGAPWHAEGFARAGKTEPGHRKPIGMTGHVQAVRERGECFELGVQYPPDQSGGWKGASGSPVFIEGKIYGVVVTSEEDFTGARVEATPTWKLLKVSGFPEALGYDERVEERNRLQRELVRALRDSPEAMEALGGRLAVEDRRDNRTVWSALLAGKILVTRPETLISEACQAHQSLLDRDAEGIAAQARAIEAVLQIVLPAIFDHAQIQLVQTQQWDVRAALITLPAGTWTAAELVMAGADSRRAKFTATGEVEPFAFPGGKYRVPTPPESGITDPSVGFVKAFDSHLIEMFVPVELRTRFAAQHDKLTELAADELEFLAKDRGESRYFVLDTTNAADRSQARAAIETLKKKYPAIAFLELSGDNVRNELRMLRPLRELLIRCAQRESAP
jgi:hypothetical protein